MTSRWSRKRKVDAEVKQYMRIIDSDAADNLPQDSLAEMADVSSFGSSSCYWPTANKSNSICDDSFNDCVEKSSFNISGDCDSINSAVRGCDEYIYSTSEYESESDFEGVENMSISSSNFKSEDKSDELKSDLVDWALSNNITHRALSQLLHILQKHFKSLPGDARTLLKTKQAVCTKSIAGGEYYHMGIANGINKMLLENKCTCIKDAVIKIQINIDGLPIYKSSNTQLWPILGKLHNSVELFGSVVNIKPIVIGIYQGKQKPSDVHEYLNEFIQEAKILETVGIVHADNCHHMFKLSAFICDMPARSFIKCVKGHGGYSGCDRCTQLGVYHGKVTYPECHAPLRTDSSFRLQSDSNHHLQLSPLCNLTIDLVNDFVVDYMHLVCLGVTRKLISLWFSGPLKTRLGPLSRKEINDKLMSFSSHMPCDFARRPRAITEFERWKATEFRSFLLYTGPVYLLDSVPTEVYNNFILLSVAMTCLLSSNLCIKDKYVDYAQDLLILFVEHFGSLYGCEAITYNVHALLHLADDAKRFGPLDLVSCFQFENCLGQLKRLIRKSNCPLQQIVRRLDEMKALKDCDAENNEVNVIFKQLHANGPTIKEINVLCQYREVKVNNLTVKLHERDKYLKLINGDIVSRENIVTDETNAVYIIYRKFHDCSSLLTYPLLSEKIGISKCGYLGQTLHFCTISDVQSKCLVIRYRSSNVVFPITHTRGIPFSMAKSFSYS